MTVGQRFGTDTDSRQLKTSLWLAVRVGRAVHALPAHVCPAVGPQGPRAHLVFLLPFAGGTIETDRLGSRRDRPIDPWSVHEGKRGGKGHIEATRTTRAAPVSRERDAESRAANKAFNVAGW